MFIGMDKKYRKTSSQTEILRLLDRYRMGDEPVTLWQGNQSRGRIVPECFIDKIEPAQKKVFLRPVVPKKMLFDWKDVIYLCKLNGDIISKFEINELQKKQIILNIPNEVIRVQTRSVDRSQYSIRDNIRCQVSIMDAYGARLISVPLKVHVISPVGIGLLLTTQNLTKVHVGTEFVFTEDFSTYVKEGVKGTILYIEPMQYKVGDSVIKYFKAGAKFTL